MESDLRVCPRWTTKIVKSFHTVPWPAPLVGHRLAASFSSGSQIPHLLHCWDCGPAVGSLCGWEGTVCWVPGWDRKCAGCASGATYPLQRPVVCCVVGKGTRFVCQQLTTEVFKGLLCIILLWDHSHVRQSTMYRYWAIPLMDTEGRSALQLTRLKAFSTGISPGRIDPPALSTAWTSSVNRKDSLYQLSNSIPNHRDVILLGLYPTSVSRHISY